MGENWSTPIIGWCVDKLQGKEAFSDGHAMFIGQPPSKHLRPEFKQGQFNKALREVMLKRMPQTKEINRFERDSIHYVEFRGGTYLQAHFLDYALRNFKDVKFYLGRRDGDGEGRAVICKVGKQVVGAIMPIRKPERGPRRPAARGK